MRASPRGQNLIEALIALGLFLVFASGFSVLAFRYWESTGRAQELQDIRIIQEEAMEAVQSLAYRDWDGLTDGTHGLSSVSGTWAFSGTSDLVNSTYTREVMVASVNRDASCTLVPVGGTVDPDTKLVTVRLRWPSRGVTQEQAQSRYFTQWQNPTGCAAPESPLDPFLGCGGLDEEQVPDEMIQRLGLAEAAGKLTCVSSRSAINVALDEANEAAVLGQNIMLTANVSGNQASTSFVLGPGSSVSGNISSVGGLLYASNTNHAGNLQSATVVWMIGTTSIAGNVRTARMEIWNGTTTISGNFRFDTSLLMRAGTRLIVAGNLTCPSGATASIDPTAVITVYGGDNCQAV